MSCENYSTFNLNKCPDAFLINAGLDSAAEYRWEFKDKFNTKYRGSNITDEAGQLTIPVEPEPVGEEEIIDNGLRKSMFQPFSGAIEFRLESTVDGKLAKHIFCGGLSFLIFLFEDVEPMPEPNNVEITIECPEV